MATGTRGAAPDLVVSVALCTRNGAAYVAEQVRSILTQEPPPAQLVVGDDASSDDTLAIVEAVVAEERATGLVIDLEVQRRSEPLGVVGNFAATMAACRGELVALSDQDDVWMPGKLAALTARFRDDPALRLVHTDARLVDRVGQPLGLRLLDALGATPREREGLARGDAFTVLLRRNLVTGATVVFRRSLLADAAPFPDDWVHDEWLAALAAATGTLRLDPEARVDYRQHGANEIGARRPTMGDRWRKLREPRRDRSARLVRRSRALIERLEALGADETRLAAARGKLAHEVARSRLPHLPIARIPGVLAGTLAGRYSRYSRGPIDILRDLVQPAEPRDPGGGA